jgi:predicted CXXCH cytochrome family protein
MRAAEVNRLCGECHRAPGAGPEPNMAKAWTVRFQPVYLAQSRCLQKSGGALSCITCHDPHESVERDAAAYNRKCLGCHQAAHPAEARAPANCTACHMPRVTPQPNLRFANHRIGVYDEDEPLQPRSR